MEKGETSEGLVAETAVDAGRRNAMRKIAVSVGVLATYSVLPESWTRPIIGQIVVPVHAATSGSSLHDPCSVEQRSGDQKSETIMIKVTGYVTPPVGGLPVVIVATATGGANQRVEGQTTTNLDGTFEAYLTVGGGPGITSIGVTTTVTGADGSANCSVNVTTNSSVSATVASGYYSGLIGVSDGNQSGDQHTCIRIDGNTATVCVYDPQDDRCYLPGSGPLNGTITILDPGRPDEHSNITVTPLSNGNVRVRLEFFFEGSTFSGEGELGPSDPCNLTAAS